MSSFANRCLDSASNAAQRVSIRMLRSSVHPSFWSPSRNAAMWACARELFSAKSISTPMRRMRSACCARATIGHVAAALPRRVMNSRRLMCPLRTCSKQGLKPSTLRTGGELQSGPMSALGQKRTCAAQNSMSALPPKADMCGALANVRFGPIADSCTAANSISIRSTRRRGRASSVECRGRAPWPS